MARLLITPILLLTTMHLLLWPNTAQVPKSRRKARTCLSPTEHLEKSRLPPRICLLLAREALVLKVDTVEATLGTMNKLGLEAVPVN